mgnify:CR=1 FL=1
MRRQGFTIAEMIVVIAVVLILAAAAIGGTSAITRSLRFTNTFNKLVFMVQQARNLAVTGNNSDTKEYVVIFEQKMSPQPDTITLFRKIDDSYTIDAGDIVIEEYKILTTTNLELTLEKIAGGSCSKIIVSFQNGAAKTSLLCDDEANPNLKIGIGDGVSSNEKHFLIHEAAGIPQVL